MPPLLTVKAERSFFFVEFLGLLVLAVAMAIAYIGSLLLFLITC